ncbi:hypothetical protein P280DRAFT_403806 [Massarina eburnea CBS 473.64]|uniref:DUF7730 domain-containing protein n=1 Tax=Massarina eburnea CBS 473.64 TaxID=1395130 RepID=A0A6A6RVD4_9PLEO|nr:hypothetical protein P280DRAFT_403806 [Massarina eburnea CBS 473.64]
MHPLNPRPDKLSPFLRLPVELRLRVYAYILPHTATIDVRLQRGDGEPERSEYNLTFVRESETSNGVWKVQKTLPRSDREIGNEIVWRRGCTAILLANHQVHDECVDAIYGDNTFVIDVTFDSIKFRQRWRTANNLTPSRSYAFLDHFSQRNLIRIKNYVVNVEHVDDYTGMIKYNCGGRGLTAGIRAKVQELVDLLSVAPYLHRLHVHLIDGAISRMKFPSGRVHRVQDVQNYSSSQTVLDPFKRLRAVTKASTTGVSPAYAKEMVDTVTTSKDTL